MTAGFSSSSNEGHLHREGHIPRSPRSSYPGGQSGNSSSSYGYTSSRHPPNMEYINGPGHQQKQWSSSPGYAHHSFPHSYSNSQYGSAYSAGAGGGVTGGGVELPPKIDRSSKPKGVRSAQERLFGSREADLCDLPNGVDLDHYPSPPAPAPAPAASASAAASAAANGSHSSHGGDYNRPAFDKDRAVKAVSIHHHHIHLPSK